MSRPASRLAAVRSAFFLALQLFTHGEPAVGGGWVARAARLLDEQGDDVVERGYLLVHLMHRHITSAEWEPALEVSLQICDYGLRYRDPDLLAMGLCSQGRLLLLTGRVNEGLAHLDEAMTGIAAGEVSPIFAGQIYCTMIEGCQEVLDFSRAAEWTMALSNWCDSQPDLVSFTGQCAVHRGQIMRLRGAYVEALDEFWQATQRYLAEGTPEPAALAMVERANVLRIQGEYAMAEEAYAEAVGRASTRSRTWRCSGSPEVERPLQWARSGGCSPSRVRPSSGCGSPRPQSTCCWPLVRWPRPARSSTRCARL